MNQNINSEKFISLSLNKNTIIIDVRTPNEYSEKRIPNSILIDFYNESFQNEINKLDKNKIYLVYCRSGSRSFQTCIYMRQLGFMHVYNLQDGIIHWSGKVESDIKN